MSAPRVPEAFELTGPTTDVLQELQVVLGVEEHHTEGLALEASLVWYDDIVRSGNVLRFSPPPGQSGWRGYTRSLEVDPGPDANGAMRGGVRVDGVAKRRLAESDGLLRLATKQGLAQIVRLKAEYAFRLADGWTIEVDTEEGATQ